MKLGRPHRRQKVWAPRLRRLSTFIDGMIVGSYLADFLANRKATSQEVPTG